MNAAQEAATALIDPATIESIRGWVSTSLLGGILMAVIYIGKPAIDFFIQARKLKLEEASAEHQRKLEEDKEDRAGWTDLIRQLRESNSTLTAEVHRLNERVAAISRQSAIQEGELEQLRGILKGLERGEIHIRTIRQRKALEGSDMSPEMEHAVEVLDQIHGKDDGEGDSDG